MESKVLSIIEFIQAPKLVLNPALDLWNEAKDWELDPKGAAL